MVQFFQRYYLIFSVYEAYSVLSVLSVEAPTIMVDYERRSIRTPPIDSSEETSVYHLDLEHFSAAPLCRHCSQFRHPRKPTSLLTRGCATRHTAEARRSSALPCADKETISHVGILCVTNIDQSAFGRDQNVVVAAEAQWASTSAAASRLIFHARPTPHAPRCLWVWDVA